MTETKPSPIGGGTLRRVHLMIRSNWISSTGAALATFAVIAELTTWILQSTGLWNWSGPYVGLVTVALLQFRPQGFVAIRSRVQEGA